MDGDDPKPRLTFPRRMRVSLKRDFDTVMRARMRQPSGPLIIFAAPNTLDHPRLGLAVPRRAGNAVRRNRIKRRLREAFRLSQHDLPGGYDLIVQVRAHEPLELSEYRQHLITAAEALDRKWTTRQRRANAAE